MYKDPEKQREACRRYYEKNRHVYREKNRRMRQRLQQMIREAKSVPCMDCGVSYPYYAMDFDHRGEKEGLVSVMINTLSPNRIRAEMAKCDVVCANCHRIRTYGGRPSTTSRSCLLARTGEGCKTKRLMRIGGFQPGQADG